MSVSIGPNIVNDGLILKLDASNIKSFKGEPTVNLLKILSDSKGGNTSLSYPSNIYICTTLEMNIIDSNSPNKQYSRFIGNTINQNNQVFTTFSTIIDVRNKTLTYSVYLKGSGICHLTIYDDVTSYGVSPNITLSNFWKRYSYTKTVGNYITNCWCGVRGIINTTDVYVSAQQIEEKSYPTPFTDSSRGTTVDTGGGWFDITGNRIKGELSNSNIGYDYNSESIIFNNDTDYINLPNDIGYRTKVSVFSWVKCNGAPKGGYHIIIGGPYLEISIPYSGSLRTGISTDNNTFTRYVTNNGSGLTDGKWHYIGFTFNESKKTSYIDGQIVGNQEDIIGNLIYSFSNRRIGRFGSDTTYALNGNIASITFYKRDLTSEEVLKNYNTTKSRFILK